MNKYNPLLDEYNLENGPAPLYKISKDLSDLTLMFIISSVVFFLAGWHSGDYNENGSI